MSLMDVPSHAQNDISAGEKAQRRRNLVNFHASIISTAAENETPFDSIGLFVKFSV